MTRYDYPCELCEQQNTEKMFRVNICGDCWADFCQFMHKYEDRVDNSPITIIPKGRVKLNA